MTSGVEPSPQPSDKAHSRTVVCKG
jgi:hypothetical protein